MPMDGWMDADGWMSMDGFPPCVPARVSRVGLRHRDDTLVHERADDGACDATANDDECVCRKKNFTTTGFGPG